MKSVACWLLVVFLLVPGQAWCGEFTFYVGEIYPFVTVDEKGAIQGAVVDVVKEMMQAIGKPVEEQDMKSINWARSFELVQFTPNHGMFCVGRTPQREQRFSWVGPVASLNLGLVARKESQIVINEPQDLKKYNIGAVRNSAPQHILENSYGISPDTLSLLNGDESQFRMLSVGRIDLVTQSDVGAPDTLRKLHMNPDDFEMVYVLKHLDLYVAFNKDTDPKLIKRMQAALDAMKHGGKGWSRYDRIMRKYLVEGPIYMKK